MNTESTTYVLTLDKIKDVIAFPPSSQIHRTLSSMVDCWYGIAKKEGKTEDEALNETLDKLGKQLLSLGK